MQNTGTARIRSIAPLNETALNRKDYGAASAARSICIAQTRTARGFRRSAQAMPVAERDRHVRALRLADRIYDAAHDADI